MFSAAQTSRHQIANGLPHKRLHLHHAATTPYRPAKSRQESASPGVQAHPAISKAVTNDAQDPMAAQGVSPEVGCIYLFGIGRHFVGNARALSRHRARRDRIRQRAAGWPQDQG